MNARTRQLRRELAKRTEAARFQTSLRKGRSIATHLIAGGIDTDTVKGMTVALRGVAKRNGIEPAKITRTRNTVDGKGGRKARLRIVKHFTAAQVQTLLALYKPRKSTYVAAKNALVAV